MSIGRWMDKEDETPEIIYITQPPKKKKIKEWNKAICSNMDATTDFHSKWSKSGDKSGDTYDITTYM